MRVDEQLPLSRKLARTCGVAAAMFLSMIYGMLVYRNQLPPFWLLFYAYVLVFGDPNKRIPADEEVPREYFETSVDNLITIRSPEDVARRREAVIAFLWNESSLPSTMPTEVMHGVSDQRYVDLPSVQRIDELLFVQDFGLESHAYHFIPRAPNNQVVLYHEGHLGDFYHSKAQISAFLERGYAVLAFCMPLFGLNNQPLVQLHRFGKMRLWDHDAMELLSPENGHPIKYFIEPIVGGLNYLEKNYRYSSISMVGISGGGWTTTLAAALDPRITKSFPVAGTYPLYLRSNSRRDWGDFEQMEPDLYRIANYLELYVLGAHGAGRRQLQIINKYDPCCFSGTKWETYRDFVRARVRKLGPGDYDLFLDDSQLEHIISEVAMKRILAELAKPN